MIFAQAAQVSPNRGMPPSVAPAVQPAIPSAAQPVFQLPQPAQPSVQRVVWPASRQVLQPAAQPVVQLPAPAVDPGSDESEGMDV